jgi:hypothetical protein
VVSNSWTYVTTHFSTKYFEGDCKEERIFSVEVSSHGFQLCHIIKCGNEIINKTTFHSG